MIVKRTSGGDVLLVTQAFTTFILQKIPAINAGINPFSIL